MLNIMVTVLAWHVEMLGFLLVFVGTHILGHQNHFVNLLLQTLTNLVYFVIIPSLLLINDTDLKAQFAESNWYDKLLSKINCQYIEQDINKKKEVGSIADATSIMEAGLETDQDIEDHISVDNGANKDSEDIQTEHHQVCVKGSSYQIYDTDTPKIDEGTHHHHSTNSTSKNCELIDLEAINRNNS